MTRDSTAAIRRSNGPVDEAFEDVRKSFERFCLAAGIETLGTMMEADVEAACGARHARTPARRAHRWGRTQGWLGFHGGKIAVERPRVRDLGGREVAIPSWETAAAEDWLGRWAMNQMLINVSTRKFARSVRLPEGDVAAGPGTGLSKSAASRHFVALSADKLEEFMAADLSRLDLLAVQIDGLHVSDGLVLVAAIGIDGEGDKHPLALVEGATENTATVQALIDNLIERGLDPTAPRLFIVDGAKALSKAIRASFGKDVAIQRCQIHKSRNIMDRLPKDLHASTRRVLRQAWELDDAAKAETLIRNLCPEPRSGPARRCREHSRGARRNPHCRAAQAAERAAPLARLYQHRREHDGHHPPRHPQCEALAGRQDGAQMGRCRHDGGHQRLPKAQSLQATSRSSSRASSPSGASHRKACCPAKQGSLTFNSAAPARSSSTPDGASPFTEFVSRRFAAYAPLLVGQSSLGGN